MTDSWIDRVLGGTMQISLPTLAITKGSGATFRGSGRLVWERGEPIRLHAQTDGAEALLAEFGQPRAAPGELLPPSQYMTLSGECSDRFRVSASPVPFDGFDHFMGSPYATWNLGLRDVRLQGEGCARGRELRALLSPCLKDWPRGTETTTNNEFFGAKSAKLDWLKLDTCAGIVAVRAREGGYGEVLVGGVDESVTQNAERLLTAIAGAFGFVMGRQVGTLAYEERKPEHLIRVLWARPRKEGGRVLCAPIAGSIQQMRHVEPLLGRAIDYFLTEPGTKVLEHLYLCWDTADRAFPTKQLVTCICLEGLLRLARTRAPGARCALAADDMVKLDSYLERNPDELSERTVARMRGQLRSMSDDRPVDILNDWCQRGVLGVAEQDVQAWRGSRNASAHAGFIGPLPEHDKLQHRVTDLIRVQNLVNRVVLQLVGYRGLYTDYASQDWGAVEFPLASPESL